MQMILKSNNADKERFMIGKVGLPNIDEYIEKQAI
jgi:hypothetical protein